MCFWSLVRVLGAGWSHRGTFCRSCQPRMCLVCSPQLRRCQYAAASSGSAAAARDGVKTFRYPTDDRRPCAAAPLSVNMFGRTRYGVALCLCKIRDLQRETEEKARQPETKLSAIAQTRHIARLRDAKRSRTRNPKPTHGARDRPKQPQQRAFVKIDVQRETEEKARQPKKKLGAIVGAFVKTRHRRGRLSVGLCTSSP
jgi:hypothetical protein